jgi:hypothetical protein
MGKKYLETKGTSLESSILGMWQEAAGSKKDEELSKKQKKLDVDGDGEIEASDLAKLRKKGAKKEGLEDSPNKANSQHLCAKNVVHEDWGEGQPVHSMHAIPDAYGNIAWYDVMFEHGIEKGVSINELKVQASEMHHNHGGKKKKNEGAMKRGKDVDTFKPKPKNEEVELKQQQEFKVQSMKDAIEEVWKVNVEDKLFEDIELMTEEQYDEFLDSLNEEEVNEIIRAIGSGIKKVATMGTAASRADRAEKKLAKAQTRAANIKKADTAKKKLAKAREKNPTVGMKAVGAAKKVGSAIMGKKKEAPA